MMAFLRQYYYENTRKFLENQVDSSINFYNKYFSVYSLKENIFDNADAFWQNSEERIEILTKKTIRDKLLEYFNIYRKKHASKIIYLPFSFTDLADFLAVDRSAMTRELKNLKEEGFIETKGRRITLLYK